MAGLHVRVRDPGHRPQQREQECQRLRGPAGDVPHRPDGRQAVKQPRAGVSHQSPQVRQGTRAIGCTFDVAYTGTDYDAGVYGENLRLVMPGGDLRAPTRAPIGNVGRDQQVQGFRAVFVVPWPAPGRYTLRLRYLDRYKSSEVHNSADVALTVPTP